MYQKTTLNARGIESRYILVLEIANLMFAKEQISFVMYLYENKCVPKTTMRMEYGRSCYHEQIFAGIHRPRHHQ